MQKKLFLGFFIVLVLGCALAGPVSAQPSSFSVHLNRDFGFGNGANIRGKFTISLVGESAVVESVTFLIDGKEMAVVSPAPFEFQFNTDTYGFGVRRLWAEVVLPGGQLETTSAVQFNFISPEDERTQMTTLIGGIVGALAITFIVVTVIQAVLFRGKRKDPSQPGQPRNYVVMGGTICPKCWRPFPRHIWGFNLVIGRLDRCDNCGKWSMTTRATSEQLQAAETAERADWEDDEAVGKVSAEPEDQLDDTRYVDGV